MPTTLSVIGSTRGKSGALNRKSAGDCGNEGDEPASPLKCLMFCQDDCTGLRARTILQELAQYGSGGSFDQVELRFNLMDSWGQWQMTLGENRGASMVVISAHDADSVPGEIISTLTYWVGLAEDLPHWVIVVFDSATDAPAHLDPNFEFLQTLAEKVHVEMRIIHGEGPHATLAPLVLSLRQRTKAVPDHCKEHPVRSRV